MNVQLKSTTKIVTLNGIPARIWEGTTEGGVKVHAYITRIAIDKDEPNSQQFEQELQEHSAPSPEIEAIPLRMIL
jgi:hypothetical protein